MLRDRHLFGTGIVDEKGAVIGSDIWSIGVMTYQLFKGHRPFDKPQDYGSEINYRHIHHRIRKTIFDLTVFPAIHSRSFSLPATASSRSGGVPENANVSCRTLR